MLHESVTKKTLESENIIPKRLAPTTFNNIESVGDLIDAEYVALSVDTSRWKTYRNEKAGFEVNIPPNWFCGNTRLDPTSSKSVVCLNDKDKEGYYAGASVVDGYIMVNFPDVHEIVGFSFWDNLLNAKNTGSKIYKALIDKRSSVIIINAEQLIDVRDATYSWNIVSSSVVERDVFDGFVETFRFLP